MNIHGIRAIYRFEMARAFRTLTQSIVAPVLSTSLYFIVFGTAIGSRMGDIDNVSYGAFIIPAIFKIQVDAGKVEVALYGFAFFYLLCLVLNWYYYARTNAEVKC